MGPGTYVLEVLARDHVFDKVCPITSRVAVSPHVLYLQLRVDVLELADVPSPDSDSALEPTPSVQVRPLVPGTPHSPTPPLPLLSYPISLHAQRAKTYFIPRESFDVISMFKNPMMLMMLFTGVMVFLMPKLMVRLIPFTQTRSRPADLRTNV